jgi:outer membrane protein assembly factor BamB
VKFSRLRCCLVVLLIAAICSCTKPADDAGFDWPQWRGPDGNGQSRETEWNPTSITKPRILWKYDVGYGYPNVAIPDGRLYTVGMKGSDAIVFWLDAATGKRVWETSLGPAGEPQATPAVDGDSHFVLSAKRVLYCLDT